MDKWGLVDSSDKDWIEFKNKTISKGLYFRMSPSLEEIGNEYELFLTLTD